MKTFRISIRSEDLLDDIEICAWCFTQLEENDSYCGNCGRYIDTEIDPVLDFEEFEKHLIVLKQK